MARVRLQLSVSGNWALTKISLTLLLMVMSYYWKAKTFLRRSEE